ncbi:unnamed protein product [Citrullus colocynthis]|uniref:Uncharacterized protein n=1 Tax=Citrullus colocynthis TaxID=252529 RepID=A0ABP0XTM7_9ROSI
MLPATKQTTKGTLLNGNAANTSCLPLLKQHACRCRTISIDARQAVSRFFFFLVFVTAFFSLDERQRGSAVDFRAVSVTGAVTKEFQGRWGICFVLH